jgi:iron-sulfur cluster assembly protein/iron-sulfur cluster insertion protein
MAVGEKLFCNPLNADIMPARQRSSMITLTPPAVDKARELLATEEDAVALRVGVRPGGCSGFSYEMFFDSKVDELEDFVKDYDGVKVAVDRQSAEMLQGAEVDFVDGLQGAGFKISNPNASRSCGCGSSFS